MYDEDDLGRCFWDFYGPQPGTPVQKLYRAFLDLLNIERERGIAFVERLSEVGCHGNPIEEKHVFDFCLPFVATFYYPRIVDGLRNYPRMLYSVTCDSIVEIAKATECSREIAAKEAEWSEMIESRMQAKHPEPSIAYITALLIPKFLRRHRLRLCRGVERGYVNSAVDRTVAGYFRGDDGNSPRRVCMAIE